MATACGKEKFRNGQDAAVRARAVQRHRPSGWKYGVYQCDRCRTATGSRAWHWGNKRVRRSRRKQW